MGSILLIRQAHPSDIAFVVDLARRVFSRFGEYDRILPEWLQERGVITVVAEESNEPVGFAMLRFNTSWLWRTALVAELLAIAVVPERQREGIGQLLLERVESIAREHGAGSIHLHTAEDNFAAQSFFLRSGFTSVDVKEGYYPAGQRAILMIKRLGRGDP